MELHCQQKEEKLKKEKRIIKIIPLLYDHSDNLPESVASVLEEIQEEKRQHLFAIITNEDTGMSAKERYLARKRVKLSQPTDDE